MDEIMNIPDLDREFGVIPQCERIVVDFHTKEHRVSFSDEVILNDSFSDMLDYTIRNERAQGFHVHRLRIEYDDMHNQHWIIMTVAKLPPPTARFNHTTNRAIIKSLKKLGIVLYDDDDDNNNNNNNNNNDISKKMWLIIPDEAESDYTCSHCYASLPDGASSLNYNFEKRFFYCPYCKFELDEGHVE